jgi:hypothetical protein
MHFILDHLATIVPATIILMLLAALQLRTQDENLDAFRSETNRARMAELVQVVERDLRNAGSGSTTGSILGHSSATPAPGAPVTLLDFVTRIDTSATAPPVRVQYELALVDSTVVDGDVVHLLELRRLGVEAGGTVLLSRTPASLTSFSIRLLDQNETPPAGLDQVRGIEVAATAISPFGPDSITRGSSWSTTVWPINLRSSP